jgi:hypothetical protein
MRKRRLTADGCVRRPKRSPVKSGPQPRPVLTSGSEHAQQQRDDEDDEENIKEDLGDLGRAGCNTREAEYRGDDCDDKKHSCVVKHGFLSLFWITMQCGCAACCGYADGPARQVRSAPRG